MTHLLNVNNKQYGEFRLNFSGQMDCAPGWGAEYHKNQINGLLLHVIRRGKGIFESPSGRYQLKENMAFIMRSGLDYYYEADEEDPWSYMWICISGDMVNRVIEHLQKINCEILAFSDMKPVLDCFESLLSHNSINSLEDELYYNGVISTILYHCLKAEPADNLHLIKSDPEGDTLANEKRYIYLASGFIAQNYCMDITVKDIANYVGIDRSYFGKLFKKHTGVTAGKYLQQYRMNKAMFLLESSHDSIADIARSVGFNYEHYFINVFKQYTGFTPSEYRKWHTQNSHGKTRQQNGGITL